MAETELKKGKHSMKTILEKAKKWFASVHSEVPAFCKLCKVTIFLITKTIKKKDTSVDKSAFAELRTKTPNAQIAFGGIVVAILLVLLMRGCGDPRKDALKLVAELQEHENQRQIEIANKQEAEQKAYEEKQSACDKAIAALETSHAEIVQKWKEREAAAFAKIDDELGTLSKRILSDKGWPRLTLAGVTLCEPLPPELSDFGMEQELKLPKPFMGFTSMRVHLNGPAAFVGKSSCEWHETKGVRIVNSITLHGDTKIPMKEIPAAIKKIEPAISKLFASSPIYELWMEIVDAVRWEGLPQWEATLQATKNEKSLLQIELRGYDFYDMVKEILDNAAINMVNAHHAKFEAELKQIEEEFNQRRKELK